MEKKHFLIGLLIMAMGLAGAVLPAIAQNGEATDPGAVNGQVQEDGQNGTDTPEGAPQTGHGWASQ